MPPRYPPKRHPSLFPEDLWQMDPPILRDPAVARSGSPFFCRRICLLPVAAGPRPRAAGRESAGRSGRTRPVDPALGFARSWEPASLPNHPAQRGGLSRFPGLEGIHQQFGRIGPTEVLLRLFGGDGAGGVQRCIDTTGPARGRAPCDRETPISLSPARRARTIGAAPASGQDGSVKRKHPAVPIREKSARESNGYLQ